MNPIINPGGSGGGGSLPFTTVNISSAELLALAGTPKQLLPAPGGRKYYQLGEFVLHYRFGTTPYVGNFSAFVGFGSTVAELTGAGAVGVAANYYPGGPVLLNQTADAYIFGTFQDVWSSTNNGVGWLASDIENKAVSVCSAQTDGTPRPNVTLGDGTLTVRIFYTLIDGAP